MQQTELPKLTNLTSQITCWPSWLQLFGRPCLWWHGQPHRIARRQPQALFYYLLLHEQPVTRAGLCRLFWPEEAPLYAQRRLTHVLDDLQRSLPMPDLLQKSKDTIDLQREDLHSDVVAFQRLTTPTASMAALELAIALYRAPLLLGFTLMHHPNFDLWLMSERAAWEERYLATLTRAVEQQAAAGQTQRAISHALRYLYGNVTDEAIHRRLIELYGWLGDRDAVQRQYRWCASVLARELGVQPALETEAVYTLALNKRYRR